MFKKQELVPGIYEPRKDKWYDLPLNLLMRIYGYALYSADHNDRYTLIVEPKEETLLYRQDALSKSIMVFNEIISIIVDHPEKCSADQHYFTVGEYKFWIANRHIPDAIKDNSFYPIPPILWFDCQINRLLDAYDWWIVHHFQLPKQGENK